MSTKPVIWMIRPWICDFSAHDHFYQPLGFLTLAQILRKLGAELYYLDCLSTASDSHGKGVKTGKAWGRYHAERIEKPNIFNRIPRYYYRYGITDADYEKAIGILPYPHVVLITSGMTYWYQGIQQIVHCIRRSFGSVPIALGGVYPTLCSDHAVKHTGVDAVFPGAVDSQFFEWLTVKTGSEFCFKPGLLNELPAWDLVPELSYGLVWTSMGCLQKCDYCACSFIHKSPRTAALDHIAQQIELLYETFNINILALYDDDPFVFGKQPFISFLTFLSTLNHSITWYLPNALPATCIDPEVASLLKQCEFTQPRLSLPHTNRHLSSNGLSKFARQQFQNAANNLKNAGFSVADISTYLIAGLSNQRLSWLSAACRQLIDMGIRPYLSQFSPVPGTPLGDQRLQELGYQDSGELLLTNKTLSVYQHPNWSGTEFYELVSHMRAWQQWGDEAEKRVIEEDINSSAL